MERVILIIFCFVATSIYGQENELYIIFETSGDNTYLWSRNIGDTLEVKSFEIKKNIPEEKYVYSLYFKEGVLTRLIKGDLSWGNKGTLTFTFISAEDKKFILKRSLKKLNVFNTSDLEKTEFSSLRKVVNASDKIFILLKENPKDKFYTAYKVKP